MIYGLYKITNLVDGKMYIGKHVTDDIDDDYMGSGKYLKRAIKKYGRENFRKEWLGFYEDEEELNYMERVFVDDTWVSRSDTYNLKIGGEGGSARGRVVSEETRRKMSESHIGRPNLYLRGRVQSLEERKRRSMANKGKPKSIEHRLKLSLSVRGEKSFAFGTHWYNNGIKSIQAKTCPDGYVKGRLRK